MQRLAPLVALALTIAGPVHAAGIVAGRVDGARLTLEGDDAPNAIVVTSGAAEDEILVLGDDGTAVVGLPGGTGAGIRRIVVHMGDGSDRVDLRQLRVRGAVVVRLDRGDDALVTEQARVHRLDVRAGHGVDTVFVGRQTRVAQRLSVRTGNDGDAVTIESAVVSALSVSTGRGGDILRLFDTAVVRGTRVFTGNDQDTVTFELSEFFRDVDLNLGDADDLLILDTVIFYSDSDLDGGSDDDVLVFDGPVGFDEDPRVDFEFGG